MLGAKLTVQQRRITGLFCAQNNIGFYAASKEDKRKWSKKGAQTQIDKKIGIHNPDVFKKNASLGGKASIKSLNNPWSYWASKEGMSQRGRMGSKAVYERRTIMHKPGIKSFKRIKNEEVQSMLLQGYVIGSKTSNQNNKRKKRVISS